VPISHASAGVAAPVAETSRVTWVGATGTALAVLIATGCGGSSGTRPIYHVRVTAGDQAVQLLGCQDCPLTVAAGGEVGFVEKRQLPRTYSLVVGGRIAACPALHAIATLPHAKVEYGVNWFLVPTASGGCAIAPLRVPTPGG
jgi:hypothetical protein